ncbi:MAG: hypothetical protein P8X67_00750 [Syntrophobacterales bacterium]
MALTNDGSGGVLVQAGIVRIIHESAAPTLHMGVLPGVLESRTLRRTIQVRLGCEILWLPGGKPISTVS